MKTAVITIMMLFFCASVHAECSTEERIKLSQSGYSKAEVEQMCNKPTECCCSYQTLSSGDVMRGGGNVEQHYKWANADECLRFKAKGVASVFGMPVPVDDSLAPSSCTSSSYCGR